MKRPGDQKHSNQKKVKIDLPWNRVWTELSKEIFDKGPADKIKSDKSRKKQIKLLDQTFQLLLDKIIRQN